MAARAPNAREKNKLAARGAAHKVSDMDSAATAYTHAHWVGGVALDEGAVR